MKKLLVMFISIVLMLNSTVFATVNFLDGWTFYKEIKIQGENKYKYFFVDSDVYKNAQSDLGDIRLVDNKGQFVPYYIVNQTSDFQTINTIYNTDLINSFNKGYDTFYDFKIKSTDSNTDVIGNKLLLLSENRNFFKNIEILASHDNLRWEYIQNQEIYNINNVSRMDVKFNGIYKYDYYRIKVSNNLENVKISGIQLVYDYSVINKTEYKRETPIKYEIRNDKKATIINIKNDSKLNIVNFKFNIAGNFSRSYEVFYGENNVYRSTGVSGDLYNFEHGSQKLNNVSISFNSPINKREIQIKVNNFDDKPLDIKSISQEYVVDKLVFEKSSDTQYKIYFGNEKVDSPKYDILKYKNYIENEKQDLCEMFDDLKEIQKTSVTQVFDYKKIYNISLISLSGFLIVIIILKLRPSKDK